MALIDFKCGKCGYKFFELVNFNDRDKVKCPKCQSSDVKQIYEGQCYFNSPKKESNTACENYGRCCACEGMCH